jgi:hypothetical protein
MRRSQLTEDQHQALNQRDAIENARLQNIASQAREIVTTGRQLDDQLAGFEQRIDAALARLSEAS